MLQQELLASLSHYAAWHLYNPAKTQRLITFVPHLIQEKGIVTFLTLIIVHIGIVLLLPLLGPLLPEINI